MAKKRDAHPRPQAEDPKPFDPLSIIDPNYGVGPDPVPMETDPPAMSDTVSSYLRKQVMTDIYGTEEPTAWERTLQAIRERL